MKNLLKLFALISLISMGTIFTACQQRATNRQYIVSAPAGNRYCEVAKSGETIIPNGRILTPMGKQITVAPHPYGLVLSPDGTVAVTANSGTNPFSISVIKNLDSDDIQVTQIPEGPDNDKGVLESVFMGLAITNDNKNVYVSGGNSNNIYVFDLNTSQKVDSINCASSWNGNEYSYGYLGDLVLSTDGNTLYVVDQINFCLNIIDIKQRKLVNRVRVGRYPFGVTLSPDGKKAYVANVGMYEYKAITGLDAKHLKEQSLDFPTSAYMSEHAIEGYALNDSMSVPPLGDPNVPESFSVWVVNLGDSAYVSSKIKTGFLVGQVIEGIAAVGGSSPNSVVASDKYLFVSNGNNDLISVIDPDTDTLIKHIHLYPDARFSNLRGVIPFGLALSPNMKRLYVAESGINAVAVINAETFDVLGHIPVGWFPSKLKVTPDGKKLVVANAKGFGSGPNGGADFDPSIAGTYIGSIMYGTVSILDIPDESQLGALSQKVVSNNFKIEPYKKNQDNNPVPAYPGEFTSPIKYVVFLSKENRTFDEVFGQVKEARGDPSMARYGAGVSFHNNKRTDSVINADIMVNHLALAQRFAMSDNFYVDSDVSADGHRWLTCTYPNEWVETSVSASYGGRRGMRQNSAAPGNFAFVGSSGAIYPEDYNEAGSMWEHLERNNISLFNFGFSVELAGAISDSTMKYGGEKYLVNYPVPAPVFVNSSRKYPTFNMAIPDQFRADIFIDEYTQKWLKPGMEPPGFISLILPNDHGAGERPAAGFPFRESYMADNDLALGRIIEFLSSTPFWKNMAIVVTEDDAQNGQDHVDAHRSIVMIISPYAKKNYVGHHHYSFGSIFKTFWNILGIPYLNQFDAGASDLSDLFSIQPDFTPYHALPVDVRVFDPQKALDPFDEKFDWKAVANSPKLDHVDDMINP